MTPASRTFEVPEKFSIPVECPVCSSIAEIDAHDGFSGSFRPNILLRGKTDTTQATTNDAASEPHTPAINEALKTLDNLRIIKVALDKMKVSEDTLSGSLESAIAETNAKFEEIIERVRGVWANTLRVIETVHQFYKDHVDALSFLEDKRQELILQCRQGNTTQLNVIETMDRMILEHGLPIPAFSKTNFQIHPAYAINTLTQAMTCSHTFSGPCEVFAKSSGEFILENRYIVPIKESLNLSSQMCRFEDNDAELLAKELINNRTLTHLNISKAPVTKGLQMIANALKYNTSLQILDISYYHRLDDEGVYALTDCLGTNSSIKVLNLEGCTRLTHHLNEISRWESLTDVLATKAKLTELNLNSVYIGPEFAPKLANALLTNTVLRKLHIKMAGMNAQGGAIVFDALAKNKALELLDATENSLGDEGGIAFGEMLRTNECLTTAILHWNMITPGGIKGILEGLKHNKTLTKLDYIGLEYVDRDRAYRLGLSVSRMNRSNPDLDKEINELLQRNQNKELPR